MPLLTTYNSPDPITAYYNVSLIATRVVVDIGFRSSIGFGRPTNGNRQVLTLFKVVLASRIKNKRSHEDGSRWALGSMQV